MTQDEIIIAMAREAGISSVWAEASTRQLERFAALVVAHEREKQAEQEPVGVVTSKALDGVVQWKGWIPREGTKLYAAPVQQAEQEPVWYARKDQLQKCVRSTGLCEISPEPRQDRIPLYAAPVRTKDLTDEEVMDLAMNEGAMEFDCEKISFARAIIAADREKNK